MLHDVPHELLFAAAVGEVLADGAVARVESGRKLEDLEVVTDDRRRGPGEIGFDAKPAYVAVGAEVPALGERKD